MTKRKSKKELITQAVLDQLPNSPISFEHAIKEWFFTSANSDALRLTLHGDLAFKEAEIEFFTIPIDVTHYTWYSFVSECSKKLQSPYFLGVNKKENNKPEPFIRIYDGKIAMMLTLYGDIHSYLDSIKVKR